jgi:hypothetical protein
MDAPSFYRAVDAHLCQGDILERVPHLLLKDQPRLLRKAALPGKRIGYELDELPEGALPTTPEEGGLVPATCHVTRAMLLTHDCEIDKDQKHRCLALIRPLPANMPPQDRATIQQNQRFPSFFSQLDGSSSRKVTSISGEFARSRRSGWTVQHAWLP